MTAEMPPLVVDARPVGLNARDSPGVVGCAITSRRAPSVGTDHSKSQAVLTRIMEILRPWGVEPAPRAQALPSSTFRFIWIEISCRASRRPAVTCPAWSSQTC